MVSKLTRLRCSLVAWRGHVWRDYKVRMTLVVKNTKTITIQFIQAEERGKGCGRKAVERLTRFLKGSTVSEIRIEVHPQPPRNGLTGEDTTRNLERFWKSVGFREYKSVDKVKYMRMVIA